jgi:hypothetical protein
MRYIRTKDTIFEVVEETDTIYRVKAKGNPHNIYSKSKCQTEVVRFADTIEELLDERVIIDALGYHIIVKTDLEEIYWKQHDVECVKCYGAIWTDKGLIYVAKMNDKGELELL